MTDRTGPGPLDHVSARAGLTRRKDEDVLRAVNDIRESHIDVFSGRHSALQPHQDIEASIAEIVIKPGQGMDRTAYRHELADSVALRGVAARHSVPLLETLLEQSDEELKEHVCLGLARIFPWGDECLLSVLENGGSPELRRDARQWMEWNANTRKAEERELRLAPSVFFSRITHAGSKESRFVLERFRAHSDSLIRMRATDLLNQMSAVGY